MSRILWGEFKDDEKPNEVNKIITVTAKRAKLEEVQPHSPSNDIRSVSVKVKNPLVTQTIEVMQQTEMLQSLIDTYSNKSGSSNYLLNPCQMIPEVDFPPENAADLVTDDKFAKPIWFIPPLDTGFARGVPRRYPQINVEVCRASLRKAVCGQLRVAGFTDTAKSAIVLFADAVAEFVHNFMQQIREVHANDPQLETQTEVEVKTLEKAYCSLTNSSLTQVHNYFKHSLVARNRSEIAEFNGVLQDYDKLMKESQSMQKDEFQESNFLNILEMPQSNEAVNSVGSSVQDTASGTSAMLNMFEGPRTISMQHGGSAFKDMFNVKPGELEASIQEHHSRDGINPYTTSPSLLQDH